MGVLPDWMIRLRLVKKDTSRRLVIRPFSGGTKEPGKLSYGLSSYGYDIRLGHKYRIFANTGGTVVDPLCLREESLIPHEGDFCIIPPNAYVLGESLEYFEVPEDVICVVLGKSSYARAGIGLNMTPLEAGWKGVITLEIANHTPLPARIHSGQGIGQVLFLEGSAPCNVPYGKKSGASYQNQEGLTLPRA